MKPYVKPGIALGALTGLLLTAPLIAVFYVGWRIGGLSFAPFIIFDWITRVLPGNVVTFGIDTIVHIIRSLNLADTAKSAKTAEHLMAVAAFLILCVTVSSIYFGIMRFADKKYSLAAGIVTGSLTGLCVLFFSYSIHQNITVNPFIHATWIMSALLSWGAVSGWVYQRLALKSDRIVAPSDEEHLSIEKIDRRKFLIKLGSAVAVITVSGAILGRAAGNRNENEISETEELWSSNNPLPNSNASINPAPGTRPEFTPVTQHYRIDINSMPLKIREESWRLKINGLVEQPLGLTLEDIRSYEPLHQFITLSCISNPLGGDLIGTTRWTGASLQNMLPQFKLKPNATHLKIQAADGFYESISLEDIKADKRVMLAYAWDGIPLTAEHGFPLRIYIPNVYGMKQPKWIESIEAMDHWEEGYWVSRGWDKNAYMKATTVIDTIAADRMIRQTNKTTLVPIGGIAHAGTRGISKVEVQVDGGKWKKAKLRTPISGQTWVIWRYDWPFEKGEHTFKVRCFDGHGAPQITEEAPPHPGGASGIYTSQKTL